MCGIAGFVSDTRRREEAMDILGGMCASIRSRGPDSQGVMIRPGVALGARRLSIIDLEHGDQPLYNEDESIAVVCNGEIYNSPELRRQLQFEGHRFRTGSDCETLVHAYEQWGESFVTQLDGMFGFALWDDHLKRLILGRDRAGIKPLHYCLAAGEIIFGSEIKALLQHPAVPRTLDFDALADYFAYEYVPTPRSIFRDIRKLPPGHYLICDKGRQPELRQYWDLRLADNGRGRAKPSVEGIGKSLFAVLEEAVRRELLSDVPVGVFLSGGLDSSTVAALMMRNTTERVKSFSIGFADRSFDETKYARLVASSLGTEHYSMELRLQDMWELVPEVADFLDEPMADASLFPTYFLSKFTRGQVKVVLSGDGGDEMFAGYPTMKAHRLARYASRMPNSLTAALQWGVGRLPVSFNNGSWDFLLKRFVSGLPLDPIARHLVWHGPFIDDEATNLLSPEARLQLEPRQPYEQVYQQMQSCGSETEINRVLYMDFKTYLENDILVKVDRASMACGLEVRVPLLNNLVLDYAAQLPPDLKLRRLTGKYIFRKAVKGLVPRDIIQRSKRGFGVPISRWFSTDLKPLLLEVVDPSKIEQDGIFSAGVVRRLLSEHFSGERDNRKPLWSLFMFQQWHDRYLGNCAHSSPKRQLVREIQPTAAAL